MGYTAYRLYRPSSLGWSVGLLAILFWAVTIVRLGSTVMQRPM